MKKDEMLKQVVQHDYLKLLKQIEKKSYGRGILGYKKTIFTELQIFGI